MRAAHVLALCGVLIAAGLGLTLARRATTPAGPAPSATVRPRLPTTPPELSAEQDVASRTPSTAGLACIENALGGVQTFASVSSLRIVGTTKSADGEARPDIRMEIGVVFPDRYRLSTMPSGPSHRLQVEFARQMLMRLPRELAGVRLYERKAQGPSDDQFAIVASGLDGNLRATLFADARTCVPVAFEYIAPALPRGWDRYRVALSAYRRFGGILFPTTLKTEKNGHPSEEESVSDIQVNPRLDDDYFRTGGGSR